MANNEYEDYNEPFDGGEPHGDGTDNRKASPHNDTKVQEPQKKGAARELFEWIEVIAFSLAFVLLIFSYVGRLAVVDGNSMNNTLVNKETLVITNFMYKPKQGDIIVFQIPDKTVEDQAKAVTFGQPLVKRVIATGGQTVYIDFENWKTYVYNASDYDKELTIEEIKEKVTPFEDIYDCDINYEDEPMRQINASSEPFVVEEGKLYVMGDNRNHSSDSRYFKVGQVDERYVLGKAVLRISPFSKFGAVK